MSNMLDSKNLTEQQSLAIDLLFARVKTGQTYEQIAEAVGVSPRTLLRWRTENQAFIEAYKLSSAERLRSLLPATADYIEKALTSGDYKQSTAIKAAQLVLQANSMMGSTQEITVKIDGEQQARVQALIDSYQIDQKE